ncbi:MAG: amidohydrolase family protein, partial [Acidimicrobiales bacterium]|nr:amidohydrolase family protein [Acidimicrobiales bacterium]
SKPLIAGIVAHADLTLGSSVEEVLEAHEVAGRGLFRGIRHALAHSKHPEHMTIVGRSPAGLYENENFQEGVRTLGRLGFTYESWHYHYQNKEFLEVAASAPETTIILDHFGTPLGVGPYENKREEIFEQWCKDITEISTLPNVYAKLGGLSMPDNGFNWHLEDRPPTSDQLVEAQKRYYEHTIECFGPDRCMFESNFPVDRLSISYHVLYNAFKKMVSHFSDSEKLEMFHGTASRVYNL